jgi:hypothetical protein
LAAFVVMGAGAIQGAEENVCVATPGAEDLRAALGRPILPAGQAQAETQAFCESRVPAMPVVHSVEEWEEWSREARQRVFERVVFRGEARAWRDAPSRLDWLDLKREGDGYRVRGLRYEVIPGFWVPAVLYEPVPLPERAPLVLNVNGHDSEGKAAAYKQLLCINLAKRGVYALNLEWLGMGQLQGPGFRHDLINAMDLCGTAGVSLHYLELKRALDHMMNLPHLDRERVGITGLSGGGWQSAFFGGLEERVTLSNPVAGYSSFLTRARHLGDLGDFEQTPSDLATVVDYTHLTAMRAPFPLLLTNNAKDTCCFAAAHAQPPLLEAAGPIYELYGRRDRLRGHVNVVPGDHNYGQDNREAFYRLIRDFWWEPGRGPDAREIASDGELLKAEKLQVVLPANNLDLGQVADHLMKGLPRQRPGEAREVKRLRLRDVVKLFDPPGRIDDVGQQELLTDGLVVRRSVLKVGGTWSVPIVTIDREPGEREVAGLTMIVADGGRSSVADLVRRKAGVGHRVVLIDPWHLGESAMQSHAYLWALLVSTVGERPLGLQAGQVVVAARELAKASGLDVELVGVGPRSSVITTVAAALEAKAIAGLELRGALASLKTLIQDRRTYESSPELFGFGLLEGFDVNDLRGLVEPRKVEVHEEIETQDQPEKTR